MTTLGAPERIDHMKEDPFLDGPADALVAVVARELREVPQIKLIFGTAIEDYPREDFSMRDMPALRVYNDSYSKGAESWFIDGMLTLDILLPMNIRRAELQRFPDIISAALVQQFRRRPFFAKIRNGVPGLNFLGREFFVDKTLAFKVAENEVPAVQCKVDFRIDLRQWDAYLESDDRTVDDPFERTLKTLRGYVVTILARNDDNSTELELNAEFKTKILTP